jgi:putative component of toxin-antitoxin plasmid stabilization module
VKADVPPTNVIIFAEADGSAPLIEWLDGLDVKVRDKCIVRVERLAELGHELRRPEADFLRDGVHELRIRRGKVNYRILYFFHNDLAVLSHGCTKDDAVPPSEIERAIGHRSLYAQDPMKHQYAE